MHPIEISKEQTDGLLYEKIANNLREEILSGKLPPGHSILSESELCKAFAVSRGPVRQAMDLLVKEKLIVRLPGRGTFVRQLPNVPGPEKVRDFNIGVFIDTTSEEQWDGYVKEIIQGLNVAANDSWPKCRLVFQFHEKPHEVGSELLKKEDLDGVIFVPTGQECMDFLASSSINGKKNAVVSFFRPLETAAVSQFYIDHGEGTFQAIDYFIRSGHERIGLIVVGPISSRIDSKSHVEGYCRALDRHGLKFDTALVAETGMTMASVRASFTQMLTGKSRPTALYIGGLALFNPCIKLLEAMKLNIPTDISVIAYDDSMEAETHEPPISVVKQPFVRGTRLAIERLIAEVSKTTLDTIRVALKPELIIRDSCAAVPKE